MVLYCGACVLQLELMRTTPVQRMSAEANKNCNQWSSLLLKNSTNGDRSYATVLLVAQRELPVRAMHH